MSDSFYSPESRALQERFDSVRLADRLYDARRHDTLSDDDRALVQASSFFFIATANRDGAPDCSFKGGIPGFIAVVANNTLEFPSYDGNGMYRTLGNIRSNPAVGLLFIDFGNEKRRIRMNGLAKVIEPHEAKAVHHAAELVVTVILKDIFPNCPRYIPDGGTGASEYSPRQGYVPPDPFWKSKPDLKEVLPNKELIIKT